ncbi:reticulon-like protein B16 [Lolium perenne]|uniref:reticulon-like protein B16 n=1 Tax=Lolium perenne TaxID=4522 RepID=UPI0021F58387|nr:reticulon-like protein B16 [Lolium perenne]
MDDIVLRRSTGRCSLPRPWFQPTWWHLHHLQATYVTARVSSIKEMVNNAAASLPIKVNNMTMIAHVINLGKEFWLFFRNHCFGHSTCTVP